MGECRFDVVVISVGIATNEPPERGLSRILGVEFATAEGMLRNLPSVAAVALDRARAERLGASLLMAGIEVRVVPHDAQSKAGRRPHVTLPEFSSLLLRVRNDALRMLRLRSPQSRSLLAVADTFRPPPPPVTLILQPAAVPPPTVGASPASALGSNTALGNSACELREVGATPGALPKAPGFAATWLASARPAALTPMAAISTRAAATPLAQAPAQPELLAFGEGCDEELERAVQARWSGQQAGAVSPWRVESTRISLGFPESLEPSALREGSRSGSLEAPTSVQTVIPSALARTAHYDQSLGRANAAGVPKKRPPISFFRAPPWLRSSLPKQRRDAERMVAFEDLRTSLPTRTVWLLGALWLSVALLLWSNDLLF